MKKNIIFMVLICAMALSLCGSVAAADDMNTTIIPSYNHVYINVSNDNGVKYNLDGAYYGGPNGTYYIKADGGGLNQLHISTSNGTSDADLKGQVTVINSNSTSNSGVFYITTTGGRGFNDDIILLLSVKGPIPDDFAVHIRSSGYIWALVTPGAYNPTRPTVYQYMAGALNETFTKADFLYGPQTQRPSPGGWQPLYSGQITGDNSTAEYLMFIDLNVGNIDTRTLIDAGSAKVEYSFTNLNSTASFNTYAWTVASNQNEGINWANPTTGGNPNSIYTVNYSPITPVADFTADITSGSAPLTVKFTDKSTNYPTSWAWDFNNDGIVDSTEQNPTYTYITPGNYTVKLTVANPAGNSTVTDYINVSKSGVFVQITPSKTNPQVGDKVTYTFKLGNNGPGIAKDVVFTYVIPEGLEFAGANVDQGNYTYNATTRTLTWYVGDVIVKPDPYLWLDLNVLSAGTFNINPLVTVSGNNIGSGGNIGSLLVNAVSVPTTTVNAATKTIPMQETGVPLTGLTMALLLVGSGLALARRK